MIEKQAGILPHLGLLLAVIFWGSSFIMIKVAYRAFDPNFVMFGRMAIATVFFLPFLGRFKKQYQKGDWPFLLLMALFEPILYFTFEAKALEYTSASQAGMITAMMPILVAIPSWLILKEKITLAMILGFLMAIGGTIWLTLTATSTEQGPNPFLGNSLEFLAMVSAAGYAVSSRKLSSKYSPAMLTAVQSSLGALYFLIRILIGPESFPHHFPLSSTLALVMLGVLVSLVAYGLYNYGLAKTTATQSAIYVNLIPIVALVSSLLILKEQISPIQYAASAVIMTGVIISQLPSYLKRLR